MRLTFLGTGSAGGVPLYGCHCSACARALVLKDHIRKPCSVLVETENTRILIDAGLTDLHERFLPESLDAILLTHFHVDHVQGLFHLRWGVGHQIPVYTSDDEEGCADLYKYPGILEFHKVPIFKPFMIEDIQIVPVPLMHSKPTNGYVISKSGINTAYLTDTKGLQTETTDYLQQHPVKTLILDCTYSPKHTVPSNHNNLATALDTIQSVSPIETYLTHISHEFDNWLIEDHAKTIPDNVTIARDETSISL